MTKELTDEQIRKIICGQNTSGLYGRVRAVIAADRELQSTRHDEELTAYELTVSNLRAEIAGRGVPDGWRLVPEEPTDGMIDSGCPIDEVVDHFDIGAAYRAMLAAAPQPPSKNSAVSNNDEVICPPMLRAVPGHPCKRSGDDAWRWV